MTALRLVRGPALLLAGLLLLTGCGSFPWGKPNPNRRPLKPDEVSDFKTLFSQNCSGCHGKDGKLGPAPPLNDKLFLAIISEAQFRQVVADGRKGTLMPAFAQKSGGGLTDEQVDIIVKGIREKWGGAPDVKAKLPTYAANPKKGDADEGKMVYAMACSMCHGDNGEGKKNDAGALNNAAFLALISDQALRRIAITGRHDLGMPNFAQPRGSGKWDAMTDDDLDNLTAFLATWKKAAAPPAK